tara:strand:- start:1381 stop:2283 length:903 start_codon:yes stop_codon:yes gene_type:complete
MKKITGSIVAIVTPMHNDCSLDRTSLNKLIEWHIQAGTDGIVVVGTTGESPTVDFDEHIELIKFATEIVDGRVAVFAGTGANSTDEAISLTKEAEQIGVDASLQVTPYYNKPSQRGIIEHFSKIADATSLPIILYNVPGRTVADLNNESVKELSRHSNIIGIKDATGDLNRGQWLIKELSNNFKIYSGDDPTAAALMFCGASGNISVTANIFPKTMSLMCRAAMEGNVEEANRLNQLLLPVHKALFMESNPVPVKWLLYKIGLINWGVRSPLSEPSRETKNVLDKMLPLFEEVEAEFVRI